MSPARAILIKAQGGMRAKPEMKPWGHTDKSILSSEGAALSARASEFIRSVVPPLWGSINVSVTTNPGLAPWAMKKYRPKGLLYVFPINILYYLAVFALRHTQCKILYKDCLDISHLSEE